MQSPKGATGVSQGRKTLESKTLESETLESESLIAIVTSPISSLMVFYLATSTFSVPSRSP